MAATDLFSAQMIERLLEVRAEVLDELLEAQPGSIGADALSRQLDQLDRRLAAQAEATLPDGLSLYQRG